MSAFGVMGSPYCAVKRMFKQSEPFKGGYCLDRFERVIGNMKKAELGCILVSDPHSVYYLTGRMIHPGERMLALAVHEDGRRELFCNRLFAQRPSDDLKLIEFDDTDDCVKLLAERLPAGRVGIDKNWASRFTIGLMDARADIRPVLGSAPVDDARMCKDEYEREAMRISSRTNDAVLSRLIASIRAGDRESDLASRYIQTGKALDARGYSFPPLICFGANGAEPHHDTDDTVLRDGDMIILDVGLDVGGYMSDMTRTVVLGRATQEQRDVYELVKTANEAGRRAAAPGVPLAEIDRAARSVIEKGGYGKYFIHRTGHGIGMEVHEPPDVSATSPYVAQAGMVFSVEPGIYLPNKFGVRIEDLVLITEDGSETLNHLSHDLIEL